MSRTSDESDTSGSKERKKERKKEKEKERRKIPTPPKLAKVNLTE